MVFITSETLAETSRESKPRQPGESVGGVSLSHRGGPFRGKLRCGHLGVDSQPRSSSDDLGLVITQLSFRVSPIFFLGSLNSAF